MSQQNSLAAFTDAATAAVARAIASVQRDAQREREVRDAEHRARLAELDAVITSFRSLERQLQERLATLKDGSPGMDGKDGVDGRDGASGIDGSEGARGADGQNGASGQDGIAGPQGERGLTGERGETGPAATIEEIDAAVARYFDANPVPAGMPGERGPPGEPGEKGEQGDRGMDGAEGAAGRDGSDGAQGERGEVGAPGKLPAVRSWDDRVYYEGEVATRGGASFQALRDTGRAPPHDDWHCIAAAGVDGRDGTPFNIRGTHAVDDSYSAFDVVALNGASFVAKRDNPGPCPGDGWQMLAMQGKRGNPGERGPQGPKGSAGEAGSPVVALQINEDGLIILTNGDGTTAEGDLYPVLTKLAR